MKDGVVKKMNCPKKTLGPLRACQLCLNGAPLIEARLNLFAISMDICYSVRENKMKKSN